MHRSIDKLRLLWRDCRFILFGNRTRFGAPYFTIGERMRLLRRRFKFQADFYSEYYPDVAQTQLPPWQHYCCFGFRGNRFYSRRQAHKKLQRQAAKQAAQQQQQTPAAPSRPVSGKYLTFPLWQNLCSTAAGMLCHKQKDVRIAVILHLFYIESWAEIYSYIRVLKKFRTDFYITYTESGSDSAVPEHVRRVLPNATLIPYPNQGFDVGPFIDVLNRIDLTAYDIVYKLHSKGTARTQLYMYGQLFKKRDWFLNLYRGLFGIRRTGKVIEQLTDSRNRVGMVAAENLIINDPPHKQAFTRKIAQERFGIDLLPDYHFVAGTCFAVRAALLAPIQQLHLRITDFSATRRGEFSLAHAMERLICAMTELQGYTLHGLPTPHPRYAAMLAYRQACDPVRLLRDARFTIDYDFFYKVLEGRCIPYYEVIDICPGEIRRRWHDGKIYRLEECSPFKYLKGETAAYERYCTENAALSDFAMTKERYEALIASVTAAYDPKSMPVLESDNVIIDGQHRCCILLHRFGPEHKISVLRIYSYNP